MFKSKYAKFPFDPAKWPFFYGWMIIGFGTLGILMSIPGQTIGISAFTESLINVLGITRDQISLSYMIGTLMSAVLLTRAGKLYDTHGVRLVAGIGSFALGISLILLSQVDKIIEFIGVSNNAVSIMLIMVVGFSFIRFFGQGVLTLASRTMMMKWFDQRRGFATSFSSVFIALGFSMAPFYLEILIQNYQWNGTWLILGGVSAFIFPIVVFIFFRNSPEESGLIQDGGNYHKREKKILFPVKRIYTLSEARRTLIFWVFAGFLGMQALYITGFTFHIVSIFETVNMNRFEAISVFQPMAVASVISSLFFGWISDRIRLNFLLYAKGISAIIAILGLIFLGRHEYAFYMLVFGSGMMTGLFGVISVVTWPRLFGNVHLGAISGFCMTIIVFGSALGPIIFSLSKSHTGAYVFAGTITLVGYLILLYLATRVKNPQIELN